MTILYRIRALARRLFRRDEIEQALDTDLTDYIERSAAEKMRSGRIGILNGPGSNGEGARKSQGLKAASASRWRIGGASRPTPPAPPAIDACS